MTETAPPNPGNPPTKAKQTGRPWPFVLLLVTLMAVIVWAGRLRQGNPELDLVSWRSSYDSAIEEAQAADKPLLVVFSADWCGPCEQMKAWVYSDKQIADTIEAGFVPVRVDLTEDGSPNEYLAHRFDVAGIPALFVLDTVGTPIRSSVGYMTKNELLAWLEPSDTPRDTLISSANLTEDRPKN